MNDLTLIDTRGRDLSQSLANRGVSREDFRVLKQVIWPSAQTNEAVLMAVDYCKARGLDPLKRVVHIVPTWDNDRKCYVDSIWPGIAELRTTAMRTNAYAGRDEIVFGPDVCEQVGGIKLTYPEWAQCTVYRFVQGHRVPFVGDRVYWLEAYAGKGRDPTPNKMWAKRPRGQLAKVAEAAALRAAFPEESGGEYTAEEMEGQAAAAPMTLTITDGDFDSDAAALNAELSRPTVKTRQTTPPRVLPNGQTPPTAEPRQNRPPGRTQLLAAALKLIERAEAMEDLAAIEADIEALPTGGGTRKAAREAWEARLQDLQPEDAPEVSGEDQATWPMQARVLSMINDAPDMDRLAEAEDLIGELPAEERDEAIRRVRARTAQLNGGEVGHG